MAQTKDEKKRIAIRNAAIADVIENGLGNATVAKIANQANVSAGTIYVYYPNKEEMLQSIFIEIKSMLHDVMIDAHQSGKSSAESIRLMWFALFYFIFENPNMFAFHEVVSAERILNVQQNGNVSAMAADIHDILQSAINNGTLKSMPLDCIISLLLAPAASLARRMLSSGSKDMEKASQLFQAIWSGIANTQHNTSMAPVKAMA